MKAPLAIGLILLLAAAGCGDDDGAADGGVDGGSYCGNGEVDPGEECDDGNDDNTDGCCNTCRFCDPCTVSHYGQCTPGETVCCPTREDGSTECAASVDDPDSARCLMACDDAADCYWSNECDGAYGAHCWPAYCSAADGVGWHEPCDVAGQTGYCYPQGLAEDAWGLCVEPGTLPTGAVCEDGYDTDEVPRTVETCATGLCVGWAAEHQPICLNFCDPVAAYDGTPIGADHCPDGYNCLNYAYISATLHKRTADKGLCVPTPSTDASGLLTCDLLDDHLMADAGAICDDLLPGSLCGVFRSGSLMGTCQEMDATPLGLGALCDAGADTDGCGGGLLCQPMDPFGTADATDYACMQLCDAADPTWVCDATGLVCTSLSVAYFTEDATWDGSPSRFGLCAPPPPPAE